MQDFLTTSGLNSTHYIFLALKYFPTTVFRMRQQPWWLLSSELNNVIDTKHDLLSLSASTAILVETASEDRYMKHYYLVLCQSLSIFFVPNQLFLNACNISLKTLCGRLYKSRNSSENCCDVQLFQLYADAFGLETSLKILLIFYTHLVGQ